MLRHVGKEVGHDLFYASSHLNLLSLCSYNSSTAGTLYSTLQIIFNDIRDIIVSPIYCNLCESDVIVYDTGSVSRSRSEAVEGGKEIDTCIRDLVQRILVVLQQRLSF
jgi:hypothetical protein